MKHLKEIIPGDNAYNKLYPFPQRLPRWAAKVLLIIVAIYIIFGLISSIPVLTGN